MAGLDQPDERIDGVVGGDRRRRLQRADRARPPRAGRPISSRGLAQRGLAQVVLVVVLAAAGERDLAGVAAQVVAPRGEDDVAGSPPRRRRAARARRRRCGRGRRAPRPPRGRGGRERSACASSARERDALDTLVEHDLALERAVHRALGGDHLQALDLLLGEVRRAGAGRARSCVGQPRSAGVYSHSTSTPPMSQPLRVGVHLDRDRGAARRGSRRAAPAGSGPSSLPPVLRAARRRSARGWRTSHGVAVAGLRGWRWPSCVHRAPRLWQRVEQQPRRHLREEVCRLRAACSRRPRRSRGPARRGVGRMKNAASYSPERTSSSASSSRARVAEPVEVGDVVLGQAERALEDQRLEHAGVEAAVGLGDVRAAPRRRSPGPSASGGTARLKWASM